MFPPQEVFAASFPAQFGVVEGVSDTETNDDATTQDNRADLSVAASAPTPRRLRDLSARRRAAANAVPRSRPVASTSQSQSTICPVCRAVICDSAIHSTMWTLCCTCLPALTATATGCARCPVCRTDISDSLRIHFSALL